MKLRLMNDPILRQQTQPVDQADLAFIEQSLPQMIKIMRDEKGIALAANQVGISKSFFIMESEDPDKVILIINPEIISSDEPKPYEEGCLSIPGTTGSTMRSQNLKLRYKTLNWIDMEIELSGLMAVAVQHEMDHLNGKLYIDQIAPMKRALVVKRHLEFMKRGRR